MAKDLASVVEDAKRILPPLLEEALEEFLTQHGNDTFYAFALDFDVGCGDVSLSANTESLFERALRSYQDRPHGHIHGFEEGRRDLKYNVGDWGHAAFGGFEAFSYEDLDQENPAQWDSLEDDILDALCEILVDFRETSTFAKLKKTPCFMSYCIGHDEHYTEAVARTRRIAYGLVHARHAHAST